MLSRTQILPSVPLSCPVLRPNTSDQYTLKVLVALEMFTIPSANNSAMQPTEAFSIVGKRWNLGALQLFR